MREITAPDAIARFEEVSSIPAVDSGPRDLVGDALSSAPGLREITDPTTIERADKYFAARPTAASEFLYGLRSGGGLIENTAEALSNYFATRDGTLSAEDARADQAQRDRAGGLLGEGMDYGAIANIPDLQGSGAEAFGRITSVIADPSSLIPISPAVLGGGYTAAILAGAGVSGADSAMYELAKTGQVSAVETAKYATLGAVLGAGIHKLGVSFGRGVGAAKELDEPVTEDMMKKLIDTAEQTRVMSPEAEATQDLVRRFGIPGQGPAPRGFPGPEPRPPGRTIETPFDEATSIEARQSADLVDRFGRPSDAPQPAAPVDAGPQKLLPAPVREGEYLPAERGTNWRSPNPADPQAVLEGEFRVIHENATVLRNALGDAIDAGDHVGAARIINESLRLGYDGNGSSNIRNAQTHQQVWESVSDEAADAMRRLYGIGEPPEIASVRANPEQYARDKLAMRWKKAIANRQEVNRLTEQFGPASSPMTPEHWNLRAERNVLGERIAEARRASRYGGDRTILDDLIKQDEQVMGKIRNLSKSRGQGGFADTQLMTHIASAGIGGTVGYVYTGDANGALWGAMIGGGIPYGAGLITKRIGRGAKAAIESKPVPAAGKVAAPVTAKAIQEAAENADWAAIQGWTFRSASHKLRTAFGNIGRTFDTMLENAQRDFERNSAEELFKLNKYQREKRKAGVSREAILKAETDAMEYLRGTKKLSEINGAARMIAGNMASYFKSALSRSFKAGVITAKDHARFAAIAAKNGYFPRLYNMAFLSTKEGQNKWVETFTKVGWKPEKIETTIRNLMGDNKESRELIKEVTSKSTGTSKLVYISADVAKKMLDNFRKSHKANRSGHLENSRKIHVENESVLDPFMINDPRAVMAMYVADVEKRIAYANVFKADDQKALEMLKMIEDKYGRMAANFAGELYWQRVGDSRSSMLSQAANINDGMRELYGRVGAFQTLKLTTAALANMTQATVNSMIAMSHLSGGFRTNLKVIGGILRDLKTNPEKFAETAERSGAALETSLMQIIGEFSSVEHKIMGRTFSGKLGGLLEYFNNPTKFLKMTGFVGAEQMQRILASNMGRSYAELLMDDITKARSLGQNTAKIERQMLELGLDPTKNVWSEKEVLDAALKWSDHVNFRNTPGAMPLGWASPHASWFRKFKQYSFNQAGFIMQHVIKPMWKAETLGERVSGGITLASAAAVVGVPIDTLRSVLMGDDADYTMTERLVRGISTIGGFGIWYDIVRSKDAITSLAGPVASDIKTLVGAGKRVLTSGDHSSVRLLSDIVFGTTNIPGEKALKESLKSYY